MKNLLLVFSLMISLNINLKAQHLFLAVKSGIGLAVQEKTNYSSSVGFIPLGVSLGGGLRQLQFGADALFSPLPQRFFFYDDFTDQKRVQEDFEETYVGGFVRYNSSAYPQDEIGFIAKAGFGAVFTQKTTYALPSNFVNEQVSYQTTPQLCLEAGVTIPIPNIAHIYIGYGFHYAFNKQLYNTDVLIDQFSQSKHCFFLGLSANLDFDEL